MRRGIVIAALTSALAACSGDDGTTPRLPAAPTTVTTRAPTTTTTSSTPTSTITTAPSTTVRSTEDQIRADFDAMIRRRLACGREPSTCAIEQITVDGSQAETFLTDLMAMRVEAGLASRGEGTFRYRVDRVQVLGPTTAELVTCLFDSIVLFDVRDPDVADDDVIFDESQVSAITTWQLALEEGTWQWVTSHVNAETVGQDLCGFGS
jgi:hypothetical protein